jgi:mannose-6-phosphate isomerase-like protein (cupin superfamily)
VAARHSRSAPPKREAHCRSSKVCVQPGDVGGPPLHRHDFDEAFYVLEGEYVIKIEERLINAGVGSFVYIPGGTIHALRHTGSGRGRLLTMCHPAGIEEIFAATSAEERATIDKKYGAENVGPPLPA